MSKKRSIIMGLILVLTLAASVLLCGCSSKTETAEGDYAPDYMVLVNSETPLPEDWLSTVHFSALANSVQDDVFVEVKAYEAYLKLKAEIEKELADQDVHLELDSAYRSREAQQKIVDEFTEKYGEEYVKNYVAVPGYSEHHTGLALDLYFTIGDKTVYENEDLVQYPEIWAAIHEKLPEYGFILRFPEGKEKITGVSYEPWHLRYIDSPETAKEITEKGITLEEYLADKK
jgi:D-alanyl-D-alanine carboxypeptidase